MKDWLVKRLTPRKQKEDRWLGLAESIQTIWEQDFDPRLVRLEALRSYFSADDADLALKLREMGDYFAADMPQTKDRPIAVAWRRLELEYKDLELIITSVFRRHYSDLPVTWFPLFAPLDEPYGTRFIPADGPWPEKKNVPPEGMFLTSRGLLGTDHAHLLSLGLTKQTFLDKALPLLLRAKPLHIVFDGALWYARFEFPFEGGLIAFWERDCGVFEMDFAVQGTYFDSTDADACPLDVQKMSCRWEREQPCIAIPFIRPEERFWHMDWHAPEGFPPDWLPFDWSMAGREGEPCIPLGLYLAEKRRSVIFRQSLGELEVYVEKTPLPSCPTPFVSTIEAAGETIVLMSLKFQGLNRLDRYPHFDDIPADKFPLDMPVGGAYA